MPFDNDINEVYDSSFSQSNDDDDEIDDLYNKLYDLLIKAKKYLKLSLLKILCYIKELNNYKRRIMI